VGRPLQFNFLGHGRDRVTDLVDDGFQRVSRNCESPGPGTNLGGICQADFIANGRMFDALHGGIPWLRINGMQRSSFHFARSDSLSERNRPNAGLISIDRKTTGKMLDDNEK
jgi:hypothetical protein